MDDTPLMFTTVNDGETSGWQCVDTAIHATWSQAYDTESILWRFEWAIGSTNGGTDMQPFTSVGLATQASNTSGYE